MRDPALIGCKNNKMQSCFRCGMIAIVVLNLEAASVPVPARKVSSVVRADVRSGRLVRSVVVSSSVAPPRTSASEQPTAEVAGSVPEMIERIARSHEVEPELVHSMIRVESNYKPTAVSHKGAEGLMQLIPATARRFGVANSFNPEQNIEGGVKYLKHLLQLFNGDERLALAAYNAGEGAVARYGGIPPYPETRNYVYQVGKRLGENRNTQARAPKPETVKPAASESPRIERYVDADGREYYRAP